MTDLERARQAFIESARLLEACANASATVDDVIVVAVAVAHPDLFDIVVRAR